MLQTSSYIRAQLLHVLGLPRGRRRLPMLQIYSNKNVIFHHHVSIDVMANEAEDIARKRPRHTNVFNLASFLRHVVSNIDLFGA